MRVNKLELELEQYHNEYVIFDRSQVYPEYIVRYRV